MVSALRFFTCLVLAVCIVASVDAAISCDTVVSSLGPCYFYLRQGGIVPPSCCGGTVWLKPHQIVNKHANAYSPLQNMSLVSTKI
uniref:Bifunctional inhibitor/plant lipid transfer protein/seed storage helical domain-containing protein n=1 Tax=Brassica oleracea TaxID=3712 RepID=A0A3P6A4T6_BRAOL|nr:unnamed protein product [Brassica oleracea]